MSSSSQLPRRARTVREARAAVEAGASKRTSTIRRKRSFKRVFYTWGAESGCPGAQIRRLQNRLGVTNICRLLSSRTRSRNFMETVRDVKKLREYIA